MAENFPNLVKETDVEVQKVQRVTNMNSKRSTPRHIIKISKVKERILKDKRKREKR